MSAFYSVPTYLPWHTEWPPWWHWWLHCWMISCTTRVTPLCRSVERPCQHLCRWLHCHMLHVCRRIRLHSRTENELGREWSLTVSSHGWTRSHGEDDVVPGSIELEFQAQCSRGHPHLDIKSTLAVWPLSKHCVHELYMNY